MFNSPTAFCHVRRTYVAIDQPQRECALEHACEVEAPCPLQAMFTRCAALESSGVAAASRPSEFGALIF